MTLDEYRRRGSKPRRPSRRLEQGLQISIAEHLRWARPDCLWFHVPNGGARSKPEAARFKAMGVKAGVADLAFILPGGRAAFIELKADAGKPSEAQRDFAAECARLGSPYLVCRSIPEVEGALAAWGVTMRAKVAA